MAHNNAESLNSNNYQSSSSISLLHDNTYDTADEEIVHGIAHLKRVEALVRKKRCLSISIGLPLVVQQGIEDGVRGDVLIDSRKADGFEQFMERNHDGNDYIEFYFFNITNPHQVLKGAKPALEEIGPFCYNSFQVRGDFVWDDAADTLEYREHTYYVFNKERTIERSGGDIHSDDVPITTLNILFSGMRSMVGIALWHIACDFLLWKNDFDRLFTTRQAIEFATGYEEHIELFGGMLKIPIAFPGLMSNATKANDPNWKAKTTMRVGKHNLSQVYEIIKWQGMSEVEIECPWGKNPVAECNLDKYPCCYYSEEQRQTMYTFLSAASTNTSEPNAAALMGAFWKDFESQFLKTDNKVPVWGTVIDESVWDRNANLVHGHNGEQFAPFMDSSDDLIVFNDIAWRALKFSNYNEEEVEFKGIKMLRYTLEKSTFMNATEHPSNARYYQHGPRGLFANISMIEQGAELYVSLPHFLECDPRLVAGVEGLAPDHDKHRMQIDVEPTLGQTMVEHVRAQVNGRITRGENWGFSNWFPKVIDDTYVPIAWFDMISEINDNGATEFKQIYTARDVKKVATVAGTVLSVFCALPLIFAVSFIVRDRRNGRIIIDDVEDEYSVGMNN